MKSISIILSSILCAASPLIAQDAPKPAAEQTLPAIQSGADAISRIRADYQGGKYDELLTELDDSYKQVESESHLSGLADMRASIQPVLNLSQWEEQGLLLQKERSSALLSALTSDDAFAEKVRSAASSLSPEEEQAWLQLSHYRTMAPLSGKNADENRLIDLDIEYEYKALHLDMPLIQNQTIADRHEKHLALRMQKMERMAEASKSFQDESLKQTVQLASQSFDKKHIQQRDLGDLMALAKGKLKPQNQQEEKIASILASYQQKYSDLTKQFFETVNHD